MEEKIVYFEKPGKQNTAEALTLVKERALVRGIKKVVLASTRGGSAQAAAEILDGTSVNLVVVPWQYGFGEQQPFPSDLARKLRAEGHQVHFGTMLFHTDDLYGNNAPKALANILRVFGQGIKVCVEIIMMAADGGCVEIGEKIIAAAGTGIGTDTAVVAVASSSNKISSLRLQEIICKPF
ncbi:MAG: hypothetical protein AB1641_04245 [Thermodesulfobacteriota bacterium]